MATKASFQELQRLKQEIIELGMYLGDKTCPDWKNNVEMLNFWWNTRMMAFNTPVAYGDSQSIHHVLQNLYSDWECIRNQLAVQYMPIVNQVARRYGNENVDPGDIMQEGYRGLLRAIDSYDLDFGVPFEAYARYWLRKYLSNVVTCDANVVRIPDSAIKQRKQKTKQDATAKVEQPTFHWEIDTLEDKNYTSPAEEYVRERTRSFLNECVTRLDAKQRKIIQLRYLSGKIPTIPLEDVCKEIGCSREAARQLENRTLSTLRKKLEVGRVR